MSGLQRICTFLLVLGLLSPSLIHAQTTAPDTSAVPSQLRGRPVEAVRVLGNTTVSSAIILNLVRTREGDPFDPETVAEDYQRINTLRKFSNVEAKIEPTAGGGVIVVFIVTEQNQIKGISFNGNISIDSATIRDVVDVHEGESIDTFRLALATEAIESLYREKNYALAHVSVDSEQLSSTGQVVFNITEGPNVRIRNIDFVGARSFTESRLKGQIQSKTWIFIFRHGTYDPQTVDDDVAAVRRYYDQKGFFDAKVGRRLIWSPDMSEMQLDFIVDEGVRYTIDRVTFRGNASVTDAQLRTGLKMVEGMPYDNEILQRDLREVLRAYAPFGYIYQPQATDPDYLRIETRTRYLDEPGKVELIYDIAEGKSFHLGQILISGNSKTQDKVILREMQMAPGQLYSSAGVQDAVERLRGTPFFTRVTATPIGNDPDHRDLLVEVEENKTATFNIGAGINSNGGVGGNITYEQRNFDITNWPASWRDIISERAWVGAGQNFRASFEPGTKFTSASLRFTEPWILDQPYSFTGEAYLRNRVREHYDDRRLGGRVSLGKRFNYTWSSALTLRAESIDIDNIEDEEVRAFEILQEEGDHILTSAGIRVTRDTTTRGLLPSTGMTTSAAFEVVGAMGGDYTFPRLTLSHDQYFTLREDLLDRKTILSLHGDFGYIFSDAPFFERFYGGGLGSVRGFAFRGISPRSGPEDDRIGGDFSVTGSAEVSFPLMGDDLRGVVFADAGMVEPEFELGTIRTSVGFGIRLSLPILGQIPISFNFALPITKDRDDDTQFFSFSLGLTP